MNELTIMLVAILFPGVLLTVIYDNYTEHKPWDAFRYMLYSIISGIITYSFLQGLIFSGQFLYNVEGFRNTDWHILSVWGILQPENKEKINAIEVVVAGLIAVALGLLSVRISQGNAIHNFLIKYKVTNKYGDSSVFVKSIEITQSEYIRVIVLDEDLTFHGVAYLYHDNGSNLEITLTDVIAYETSTANEVFRANVLYISKPFGNLLFYTDINEDVNHEPRQTD
ncbi:hypothetical protein ACW5WQ_21275 [Aeromonas rivuli]|uniref:hypothetical protein n=1 Tax=Aeromonas rivuli TaxID=648794 RepID=UPI000A0650E3|nr:hypothetical protein [Aeromonas rivuli]